MSLTKKDIYFNDKDFTLIYGDCFKKLSKIDKFVSANATVEVVFQKDKNLKITEIKLNNNGDEFLASDSDDNDPSETLQSNNLEASYQKVLASMPEKRREVFLASRFDGLKYAEIAEKMGLSQKTVEAHMSAAIKQLKEGLKEYL